MVFKCPRCAEPVGSAEVCMHCGFSIVVSDKTMGADPVLLERVTDAARVLGDGEVEELEGLLDRFEAKFPQLFLGVYFGALPRQTDLSQFAFWLLNRVAISCVEVTRPNENGILLVFDTVGKNAALVCGYMVEQFLTSGDAQAALQRGEKSLSGGDWVGGVMLAVRQLTMTLVRRAEEAALPPSAALDVLPPSAVRLHEPSVPVAVAVSDEVMDGEGGVELGEVEEVVWPGLGVPVGAPDEAVGVPLAEVSAGGRKPKATTFQKRGRRSR